MNLSDRRNDGCSHFVDETCFQLVNWKVNFDILNLVGNLRYLFVSMNTS